MTTATGGYEVPSAREKPAAPASSRTASTRKWRAIASDFLERAGWSAGQVFFATLLAGGTTATVANLPWKYASVVALGAGLASLVLTGIQYLMNLKPSNFWWDLVIRLAKTFLASLAGSFAAAHPFNVFRFDWTTALNLAAVAVLTAFGKGLLARGSDTGGNSPHEALAATDVHSATDVQTPSTLPTNAYISARDSKVSWRPHGGPEAGG